jgi:hypothetical protein
MKLAKSIVLIITSALLLLIVIVAVSPVDPKQQKPDFAQYNFADTLAIRNYNLDSLKTVIGDNKGLPKGFEIAAAIAYSAFPELKDVPIEMILTPDGAPMEATPVIKSLFSLTGGRKYQILLNDAENTHFDPILLRSLPFDAQVGILAHELGHIVYYEDLNIFAFAKWGLMYLTSDDFVATHERSTDLMPIYHGLGNQIYQYAYFVRYDPSCREFYLNGKDFMDKYYLTDQELLEEMEKY